MIDTVIFTFPVRVNIFPNPIYDGLLWLYGADIAAFMMEYICVGITFKLIKDRSKVNDTKHGEICIVTFLSILLLVKL